MDEAFSTARPRRGSSQPRVFDVSTMQYISDDDEDRGDPASGHSDRSASHGRTDDTPTSAEQASGGREPQAHQTPLLYGVALRTEVFQQLRRQPSEALDDGQLAVYLQFRGVAIVAVVEWGIFQYFSQHVPGDDASRREVMLQIQQTVADMDHLRVLTFFRFMLEGEHLEAFYTNVYQLVLDRINTAERVAYFADVIQPLPPGDPEEDAITPTEPDEDSSSAHSTMLE